MKKILTKIVGLGLGFAMAIGVGVGTANSRTAIELSADEVSWVASEQNYDNAQTLTSATIDSHVSIAFTNGGTATAYYDTGTAVRIYNGGTFTVSIDAGTMSSIVLEYELNGAATISCSDSSNWTESTKTWAGTASSVTWTAGSAKHVRLSSVTVTYGGGGGPTTYSVTYNSNGGSGTLTDTNSPYAADATVTVLSNTFSYAHHTFDCWNTQADGLGTDYDPGDTFDISSPTTLYAQWIADPSYSVIYHDTNSTGGSVPTDDVSYFEGDSATISGNTNSLTRTGYIWSGWSLNSDGSGLAYGPSYITKYTVGTSNVNLYPIWIPDYEEELAFHFAGSTIHDTDTYAARSGTVDTQTTSRYDSATWQITVGNNTAELGTNAKAGNLGKTTLGEGDFGAAEGLASALGITTSTQKYSAAICTTPMSDIYEVDLFFTSTNGGAITTAWVLSSTNGTTWEIEAEKTANILTESKFTFFKNSEERQYAFVAYWNLTNSGGLRGFELKLYGDFPEEQTITASSNSAFTDETVTLTTNAATANWSITANTAGATLSTVGPAKSTVVSASQEGSVTVQAVSDGYTDVSKTITFTTRPAGNIYDVTFDSNGGSNSPDSLRVEEDDTFTFPSAGTKEHYSFDGWTSTGSAPYYAVGATSPEVVDDITYTAHWTENANVTVTYTAGADGSGSYAHVHQYLGEYTLLDYASISGAEKVNAIGGYRFKDYTVGGVHKKPGDKFTLSEATTVVVNFEETPLEYVVVFGTAEGTTGIEDFSNTSFVIPSGVTLDNIQGNVYGSDTNAAVWLRFGKSGTTGSFDVTIGDRYYIKKIIANLKYYSSDSTAEFAVTPDGGDPISKTMTSSFADYEYDISSSLVSKATLGTTINGKRVFISGFTIVYEERVSLLSTISSLRFDYEGESAPFTLSNVALRFGGFISQDLWDDLGSISEYGIIFSTDSYLGANSIQKRYKAAKEGKTAEQALAAICDGTNVRRFNTPVTTNHPAEATADQKTYLQVDPSDNYYIWTLRKDITESYYNTSYAAVAYIMVGDDVVFLQETRKTSKEIAAEIIGTSPYNNSSFKGSMYYFAHLD